MPELKQSRLTAGRLAAFIVASCVTCRSTAAEVVISFESDLVDTTAYTFTSVDSPLATFSNTYLLWVRKGLPEFDGVGIETYGPTGITIEFAKPIVSLSILFGNDDPAFPEDRALLSAFHGNDFIGRETLLFNRNDLPDQTITLTPHAPFNKAVFDYVDSSLTPVSGLGEVISEIRFQVVPEPSSLILVGIFSLFAAVDSRFRRPRRSGLA